MKKILMILTLIFMSHNVFALSEKTHEAINMAIAQRSINGFSLDTYLKNQLGFSNGKDQNLTGIDAAGNNNAKKKVYEWLGYGGVQEDRPGSNWDYVVNNPARSNNHFHNPLKPWNGAGLNDSITILVPYPPSVIVRQYIGWSSVLWAQNRNQSPGGNWNWYDARRYFYIALTGRDFNGVEIPSGRDNAFAMTFRAVGQLMHLVQDASVPEHVRNQAHPLDAYENYVEKKMGSALWNAWISNPITFDKSILNISSANTAAPVPISRIIDTDKYDGTNPWVTKTVTSSQNGQVIGQAIGLSEYTNANFLSPHTMFTDDLSPTDNHYFPYPSTENVVFSLDSTNNRGYVSTAGVGAFVDVEPVQHLAVDSILSAYRLKYFPGKGPWMPVGLDDKCREEYASKLLPRAVGYSAGLLNYFFRGTLEITNPDRCLYSIIDGSIVPQQFTQIKAKIRNTTPNEQIQSGILQAIARYKKRTDYKPALSTDPPTAASREPDFSYSVSEPITITSLDSVTPTEFTFDFSGSPIPAGITDLYLQVIFKGTLGNETDIAIAVGIKDLSEPLHHVYWNATDRFYLDGTLRTADEIRNDPVLLNRAAASGLPIDPFSVKTEIAYCPTQGRRTPTYNVIYDSMPAGTFGRIITIVGADQTEFPIIDHRISTNPPEELTTSFTSPNIINQENNGVFENSQVYTFRGIKNHAGSSYALYYPYSTGILEAPWPSVPMDTNPVSVTTINP